MATDYKYDVFLSYSHAPAVMPWVVERLYGQLCAWLCEASGGGEVRIFLDQTEITPGMHWPESLRKAIRESKCIVPVWSPSYFTSDWCMSEWKSFCEREKMLANENKARDLVVPILHNDGDCFPEEAQQTQWADFSDCCSNMPAFVYNSKSIDFEQKVKIFANNLARIVYQVPRFRPKWPTVNVRGLVLPHVDQMRL